jgi:hypothetical protein
MASHGVSLSFIGFDKWIITGLYASGLTLIMTYFAVGIVMTPTGFAVWTMTGFAVWTMMTGLAV